MAFYIPDIYYDANGGTGAIPPQHYSYSGTLMAGGFTRPGYRLTKWRSDVALIDGRFLEFDLGESMRLIPTDRPSITLFAVWETDTTTTNYQVQLTDINGLLWRTLSTSTTNTSCSFSLPEGPSVTSKTFSFGRVV